MPSKLTDFPKELSAYPLGAEELDLIGAARWEYEDGEYVIREGDADQDFFILEQGSIVVEKQGTDRSSRPLILNATLYQRGQLIAFGELAYFVGGVRTASVRSTGRSIVLRFPPATFGEIFRKHPAMAEQLFRLVGDHLRRTSEELRALQSRFGVSPQTREIRAGAVLFEEGARAETLYQCLLGRIRLDLPGGSRTVSGSDPAGQGLVDLLPYLSGGNHPAKGIAETDCALLAFGPQAREGVLHAFPQAVLEALGGKA